MYLLYVVAGGIAQVRLGKEFERCSSGSGSQRYRVISLEFIENYKDR